MEITNREIMSFYIEGDPGHKYFKQARLQPNGYILQTFSNFHLHPLPNLSHYCQHKLLSNIHFNETKHLILWIFHQVLVSPFIELGSAGVIALKCYSGALILQYLYNLNNNNEIIHQSFDTEVELITYPHVIPNP